MRVKRYRNPLSERINFYFLVFIPFIKRKTSIMIDKKELIYIFYCFTVTFYIIYLRMTIFSFFHIS